MPAPAPRQPGTLSPASCPQPASRTHKPLHPARAPAGSAAGSPSSAPRAPSEISRRPPGGRLSLWVVGRRARSSSGSAEAKAAAARTRPQPPHSAAMFARGAARAASAPGRLGLRDPAGRRAELGSWAVSAGVPAPPPPQRCAPLAAAPPGARRARAREPGPAPPRPRLARVLPLHFFPFFALHRLLPFLASFQILPQANE